ncbi:MAG: hypothetical protein KDB61_00850 [Planctomycetes bacterium]|nr:hypothetical protein [Planctomycetota bacterium]
MQTTTETQAIVIPWIPVKFGAMADKNARAYATNHIELARRDKDFTVTATNGKALIQWRFPVDEVGDNLAPIPDGWTLLIPADVMKQTGDKVRHHGQRLTLELHGDQFGTIQLDHGPVHSFQPGAGSLPEVISDLQGVNLFIKHRLRSQYTRRLSKPTVATDRLQVSHDGLLSLLKATNKMASSKNIHIEPLKDSFQKVTWPSNTDLTGIVA